VRPDAAIGDAVDIPALRYALSVQELIDDPTVVVQRLPGYMPNLRGSIEEDPASQTSSVGPETIPEVPAGEQNVSMSSQTGSAFYVQNSFLPAAGSYRLRISNGAGQDDLARKFAAFISARGFAPDFVTNAGSFDYEKSYVFYNPGLLSTAQKIAEMIPVPVKLVEASRGSGGVEIILGSDLIGFDARL
jgi:hypothetical protein